jgi:hypothetical protein
MLEELEEKIFMIYCNSSMYWFEHHKGIANKGRGGRQYSNGS